MKLIITLTSTLLALTISSAFAAGIGKTLKIGDTEVIYDYQPGEEGIEILTLIAQVSETNNSLRGLKNSDQRRLGKLGQLIYQCKLMLYKSDSNADVTDAKGPILISKNYSLFTGVNLKLGADERMSIQAQALQAVDNNSVFGASSGDSDSVKKTWASVSADSAINLQQFNVNILQDTDLIETSESIDIIAQFPVFQMEKPVSQWSYNFILKDFKQAIQHIDENCTALKFKQIINQKT